MVHRLWNTGVWIWVSTGLDKSSQVFFRWISFTMSQFVVKIFKHYMIIGVLFWAYRMLHTNMWLSLNKLSLAGSFIRLISSCVPWPLLKIFIVSCPVNFCHLLSDIFPLAKLVQFLIISSESCLSFSSGVTPRAFSPNGQPKTYARQSAWSHRHQSGFKLRMIFHVLS